MSSLLKEEDHHDSPLLPQHSPSLTISVPSSPRLGSHKPHSSAFGRARIRVAFACGAAVAVLFLLGLASKNLFRTERERVKHYGQAKERVVGQRVLIRDGGFGWEGIGSVVQRFKESIILAQALNATFLITGQESEHGYSTSDLINGPNPISVDVTKTCSLQDNLSGEDRAKLVYAWCEGKPEAAEILEELEGKLAGCTAVLDAQRWEVHEDFNGCIHNWMRSTLGTPPDTPWDPKNVTVGIHIRWGDSAGEFRGSMPIDEINRALSAIYAQYGEGNVYVTVAMEKHEERILRMVKTRGRKPRIVDSGDGIADLRELAGNNIMLIGGSSYAAVAHLIAPRGLSIVDPNIKYVNTTGFGREVIMIQDFDQSSLAGLGAIVDGTF